MWHQGVLFANMRRQSVRSHRRTPRRGIGGHGTGERHGDEPLVDSDCTASAALCAGGTLQEAGAAV